MEEEHDQSGPSSFPPSSSFSGEAGPSSSSSFPFSHLHEEPETTLTESQENPRNVSYRFDFSIINIASRNTRDNIVCSCLAVLITFWLFASIILILGLYGSLSLQLGPNCSRLITANPLLVQSIQAQEIGGTLGSMLYGFLATPVLDVKTTWTETHNASVQSNFHKEWMYYLNTGSKLDISYDVKNLSSSPLTLVIVQGKEKLTKWIKDPSYPNMTMSWNIIYGKGRIEQEITTSADYYIAVGNSNSDPLEVELNMVITALLYNITEAYFRCPLDNQVCSFSLMFLQNSPVVLTSPGPEQAKNSHGWYIRLSYGPRWFTYILVTSMLAIMVLVVYRFHKMFQPSRGDGITAHATMPAGHNQEALLSSKGDDLSSWESGSDDENQVKDGETETNSRNLCVICFDLPRDCFCLPCGHSATCFACGSRMAEEVGSCPVCQKRMKKVRKIIAV